MFTSNNNPRPSRRRPRGSVLVVVVAVLTMIALIGTAYIATARLDRYSAQAHFATSLKEATRDQYLNYVEDLVKRVIAEDFNNPVTGPRSVPWLADRLPKPVNAATLRDPFWRFISGKIHYEIDNAGNPLPWDQWDDLYESPLMPPRSLPNPYAPLNYEKPNNYARFLRPGTVNGDGANRFGVIPTSITLQYPSDYPVEQYRDKVRTFPAVIFIDPFTNEPIPSRTNPLPYLAADADGDGIADSVPFRIPSLANPVNGVTYYAALRIIDNNSAINVNTARTRGGLEYKWDSGQWKQDLSLGYTTFFPASIGLRELFWSDDVPRNPDPSRHLFAIDEYRFGYEPGVTFTRGGEFEQRPAVTFTPISDALDNAGNPIPRTDFQFGTKAEALSTQLGLRLENPGFNHDPLYTPPGFTGSVPFRYRVFDENDAAALAYRFSLLRADPQSTDLHTSLSTLESRIYDIMPPRALDALVSAAPNYTEDPRDSFSFFPATETRLWFNWINYDYDDQKPMGDVPNAAFHDTSVPGAPRRFRPVRPILTAYNATTNLITPKVNRIRWSAFPYTAQEMPNVLYPGMTVTTYQPWPGVNPKPPIKPGSIYHRLYNGRDLFFSYLGGPNSSPTQNPITDDPTGLRPVSWDPVSYTTGRTKTSINTAGFPELWRAFFMAMGGDPVRAEISPFEDEYNNMSSTQRQDIYLGMRFGTSSELNQINPLHMFRSPVRDPRTGPDKVILTPYQMMVLRSALAAVNTISLREGGDPNQIPSRTFTLYEANLNTLTPTANPQYEVTVYGMRPQPFIIEVYANNDKHNYGGYENKNGYVAIKLYNPYDVDIPLKNWKIAAFERDGTPFADSKAKLKLIKDFGATTEVIPKNGFLLLENYDSGSPGAANYRPRSSDLQLTGPLDESSATLNVIEVPELSNNASTVLDYEFILLRPVDPNATPSTDLADMVPVDQFDFTGLRPSNTQARSWHYSRDARDWKFIYPGRYDGEHSGSGSSNRRYQGLDVSDAYNPSAGEGDEWNPKNLPDNDPFPTGNGPPTPGIKLDSTSITAYSASYPNECSIPWPAKLPAPSPSNRYPFDRFARNADILHVPFIGAYTIRLLNPAADSIVEMNSVSMDSAFAEDTVYQNNRFDTAIKDGFAEQVGRFCPLTPPIGSGKALHSYDWCGRLFYYLDVHVPADDYLPNIPTRLDTPTPLPVPVPNFGQDVSLANRGYDDFAPTHGKININTASAKVLSMLPLVPDNNGGVDVQRTEDLARRIALIRDNYVESEVDAAGNPYPVFRDLFQTILDLNRIPDVRESDEGLSDETTSTKDKQGNYTDNNVNTNTGNFGYDERFHTLNRISNLITTRSDTFTVYIVVQGWREAGTPFPCLDWEQRRAFIIDRSAGPNSLKVIPVPTD